MILESLIISKRILFKKNKLNQRNIEETYNILQQLMLRLLENLKLIKNKDLFQSLDKTANKFQTKLNPNSKKYFKKCKRFL